MKYLAVDFIRNIHSVTIVSFDQMACISVRIPACSVNKNLHEFTKAESAFEILTRY